MNSKALIMAVVPLFILSGVIYYLMGPGTSFLYTTQPLPDVTIENTVFKQGQIIVNIRNTGQEAVTIAQADINDRPWDALIKPSNVLPRLATAQLTMKYPWMAGVPYEIGVTSSDGTRFAYEVKAAAPTPELNSQQLSYFAILGSYVGIVPVIIGLLWFPFMSRINKQWYNFFLSLTAGLLVFLAIDALKEAFEITHNIASAFRGEVLIVTVTIATVLVLMMFSNRIAIKIKTATAGAMEVKTKVLYGLSLSYMVAIGIGLHNLGEGLAIGAAVAVGALALSKFLVVGFAIHNTTEGLAIIAPIAKQKARIMHLLSLGLIAGAPTIVGTWIGGFTYMPVASIVFLAIGAGAIFQVVYSIFNWMNRQMESKITAPHNIAGFIVGIVIMYLTGLLVAG
ncbi:MAG: zinc transporter ZupT [Candidatus Nitrosomirales archaeon]|jgi:zinc transporter ZupT